MNILFSCDNNYAPYLAVTLSSILKSEFNSATNQRIRFFLLSAGVSEDNKHYVKKLVEHYHCQLEIIEVDLGELADLPNTIGYISAATYIRLKLADYLKVYSLKRLIYLDVDILVHQSLYPLWKTDLGGKSIGACYDNFIEPSKSDYKEKLGFSSSHYYFNTGVLLIDVEKWQAKNVFKRAMDWTTYCQDNHIEFLYQDQDMLNHIFENDVNYLDLRYNFNFNIFSRLRKKRQSKIPLKPEEKVTMPIAVSHFLGSKKAWHSQNQCAALKASKFVELFEQLENRPKDWTINTKRSFLLKIKQKIKEIEYRYRYGVY
ncbi:glycosyltransferase family 8 protein [Actinobacillus seminis]|uniref:glycosyltransferase family 8 protein n=1 Tax=Actinobacillus seminis TaxID=722 RepID=UPI003B944008